MADVEPRRRGQLVLLLAMGALIFIAEAFIFGRSQDVWIDESTQLSGAMLPLPVMLRWLAGMPLPLGVPPDRMPPVSYLVDAFALQALHFSVLGLRLLHLAVATIGLLLLLGATWRQFGRNAALVAAALALLSPKLIDSAVELRAYPLFFALTCAQIALFLVLLRRPGLPLRGLIGFVLLSLLAIYTHFFALVATSAMTVGLAVAKVRRPRDLVPLGSAYACVIIGAAGLGPFVLGSEAASSGTDSAGGLGPRTLLLFLLRQIGHSATMLSLVAALLTLGGFVLLLTLSLGGFVARLRTGLRAAAEDPRAALWSTLAAGELATLFVAIFMKGFNPLKPTYSLWTLPFFILLAAQAVSPDYPRLVRRAAMGALALFVVGGLWSTGLFLAHASWFAHGPERTIADQVEAPGGRTAIVYTSDQWPYSFFPISWRFGNGASQWWRDNDGAFHKLLRGGAIEPEAHGIGVFANDQRLLYADVHLHSYAELRELLIGIPLEPPMPSEAPTGFVESRIDRHDGLYGLTLTSFVRKDR